MPFACRVLPRHPSFSLLSSIAFRPSILNGIEDAARRPCQVAVLQQASIEIDRPVCLPKFSRVRPLPSASSVRWLSLVARPPGRRLGLSVHCQVRLQERSFRLVPRQERHQWLFRFAWLARSHFRPGSTGGGFAISSAGSPFLVLSSAGICRRSPRPWSSSSVRRYVLPGSSVRPRWCPPVVVRPLPPPFVCQKLNESQVGPQVRRRRLVCFVHRRWLSARRLARELSA